MNAVIRRYPWITRLVLLACALCFGASLVRTSCPMHGEMRGVATHGGHATGKMPAPAHHHEDGTDACRCVGSCTTVGAFVLGAGHQVPVVSVILLAHVNPLAHVPILGVRTQTRLPFSNGPPVA